MKKIIAGLCFLFLTTGLFTQSNMVASETYASFYGEEFNGRQTANGEIYDMNAFTAAHRTLPFGSVVEVTNLDNSATVFVRINDRGPFVANREIDLSKAAANAIGMLQTGTARVSIKLVSTPTQTAGQNPQTSPPQTSPNTVTPNTTPVVTANTTKPATPNTAPAVATNTTKPATSGTVYTPVQKAEGVVLWRIQLGSFTREENALRLVESLRKIGFEPAYEKADNMRRVVLYGISQGDLEKVKKVLETNDFRDYIIRQESW